MDSQPSTLKHSIIEANLQSKLKMMKEISRTSVTNNKKGNSKSNTVTTFEMNIPPQRPHAEKWERECDLTSSRYSEGEYVLELSSVSTNRNEIKNNNEDQIEEDSEMPKKIVIHETFTHIGTRVWDCSIFMVRWFEHCKRNQIPLYPPEMLTKSSKSSTNNGKPLSNLRILELGAGTGLLSIALSKLFQAEVIATEYGPIVSHLFQNCKRNNVLVEEEKEEEEEEEYHSSQSNNNNIQNPYRKGKVSCIELDWYKVNKYPTSSPLHHPNYPSFHIVVVCDCTLTPNDSKSLVDVMLKYTSPETVVYVGVCNEREGTPTFWELVKKEFQTIEVLVAPEKDKNEYTDCKIKSANENSFSFRSQRHVIARLMKH